MIEFRLDEYLKEHEISLHWLHKATGIRYATLFDWKENKTKAISMEKLYLIVKALNIKDMNLLFKTV